MRPMKKMENRVDKRFYNIWGITHLGAYLNGIQEVMGSKSTISTFMISRSMKACGLNFNL